MSSLHLFDTLLEPVFVLNQNKEVLYCNEVAANIAGSTPRKIIRAKSLIDSLFTFESPTDFLNLASIKDPTPYRELRFKNQQGQSGIVQITVQKLTDNDDQWLVFVRDVTLEEQLQNKYRAQLEQKESVILELQAAQAELQHYSKNLETLVQQRTQQISELNQTMMALLNSLKQGFFIFNDAGDCLPVFSKACEEILETRPAGQKIWEVLKIPQGKVESFKRWMQTLFGEMLPFEDLTPLGPSNYFHSRGKTISLEYFPLRNSENKITGVVVMAADITDLIHAQQEAEHEKSRVKLVLQIVQNKKHLGTFIKEIESWFRLLENELSNQNSSFNVEEVKRALHTIKGNASLYSIKDLVDATHICEEEVAENPIEVWQPFVAKHLPHMIFCFEAFLKQAEEILGSVRGHQENKIEVLEHDLKTICEILSFWSKGQSLATQISEKYLQPRLHALFEPFNQITQQTALQLGKLVRPIKLSGPDIPLGNLDLSSLFSSLVHCFRNSIDHGLETPEQRENAGKPRDGLIQITTGTFTKDHQNYLFFSIQDDGGGVNPARIREKLIARGISTEGETDQQVIQHIFDASFSTKTEITEISGRGVGLDAVKAAVADLQGEVFVKSVLGQGTTFEFTIPLPTPITATIDLQQNAA